jgi:MerR family transcriptional regulator, redox-sensitive transcriptional activator SoxR
VAESRLPIADVARRSGVAASTLRFYEDQGLLASVRSAGGRRQYARSDLRRIAFIRAAQAVGLTLEQVRSTLDGLPEGRTPTAKDWQHLSSAWQPLLDRRIAELNRLRTVLSSCIGCGCLSLSKCALYNPLDAAARRGPGARYLLGDLPPKPKTQSGNTQLAKTHVAKTHVAKNHSAKAGAAKVRVTEQAEVKRAPRKGP